MKIFLIDKYFNLVNLDSDKMLNPLSPIKLLSRFNFSNLLNLEVYF